MNERPLLLLLEDDERLRMRLARAFKERGVDVRTAATIGEAQHLISEEAPEMAVLDLRVPDGQPLDLITLLKTADPETRIVVVTGYGSIATAIEAMRRGATNYLTKPADADEILAAFLPPGADRAVPPPSHPMSLDRLEWEHINRVLQDCHGNISETARVLGLHRRSLQRKLAKHPAPR
jgi:two-component system response regulator RegA